MITKKEKSSVKAADHMATIVCGIIVLTGAALACRIQIAYSPSLWTHVLIALSPALIASFVPILMSKSWLWRKRERSPNTQAGDRSAPTRSEIELNAVPPKPGARVPRTFERFVA